MDILEALSGKRDFTVAETVIADYILEHLDVISGLSADSIARKTGYSIASVTRLCQKIGFSGYREFHTALLLHISAQGIHLDLTHRETVCNDTPTSAGLDLFSLVMAKAVENCRLWIPEQSLCEAAHLLSSARRVGLYGPNFLTMPGLCRAFTGMGIASFISECFYDEELNRYGLAEGDTALVMAWHPFPVMCNWLAGFRSRGVSVILITTEGINPEADVILQFPKAETDFYEAEMLYRQTAFMYLSACLSHLVRMELS